MSPNKLTQSDLQNCYAVVKFSSDDDLEEGLPGHISVDANAWNAEAQADLFTAKNDLLVKNYWAPRWKVSYMLSPVS